MSEPLVEHAKLLTLHTGIHYCSKLLMSDKPKSLKRLLDYFDPKYEWN